MQGTECALWDPRMPVLHFEFVLEPFDFIFVLYVLIHTAKDTKYAEPCLEFFGPRGPILDFYVFRSIFLCFRIVH